MGRRLKWKPYEPRPCVDCGLTKEADQFHVKTRDADGNPRSRQSYCKPCGRERERKAYQPRQRKPGISHEEELARKRARYRENMQDPEKRERHRVQTREANRKRHARAQVDQRVRESLRESQRKWYREKIYADPERHAAFLIDARIRNRDNNGSRRILTNAIDAFRSEYHPLDAEPFREWLRQTFPAVTIVDIAEELGIADRQIREVLTYNGKTVPLRLVDRAFTNIGRPDLLEALYPLEEAA